MTREELDELGLIISDLRIAIDIKEQIEAGEERGLIDFADGETIKIPVPEEARERLNVKIAQLSNLLKEKADMVGTNEASNVSTA